MVQGPSITAVEALRDASASIDEQIAILRQLKNDIVGHVQRKELVVKQAAVEPLVRVVSSANDGASDGQENGWSRRDEARLQATLVLGSLAAGGASFMPPLLAADAPECLLSALQSHKSTKQLVATLQALRNLAEQSQANMCQDSLPRVNLIDHRSLAVFEAILRGQIQPPQWKQLFHLTADVIIASAVDEETKDRLLDSGIWSPLLHLYATAAPDKSSSEGDAGISAFTRKDLPKVTSAITAIIEDSNYRAERFMRGPHVAAVHTRAGIRLPQIHVSPLKHVNFNATSSSFPALASLQPMSGDRGPSAVPTPPAAADIAHLHWTVCMQQVISLKHVPASGRLPALRLLAAVNNAIDAHHFLEPQTTENQQRTRERERYIALCAVPVAVRLVQTACEKTGVDDMSVAEQQAHRELKPEACDVLARLIRGSKELQVAAVDSGAIKRICPILKKSFDNVASTKPMWSSRPSNPEHDDTVPASCMLGSRGMPAELDYAMRCRRGALEAVAALASKEDIHRQAIVQAGVIACIIDSLKPFSPDAFEKTGKSGQQVSPKDGNTTPVIIAACHAAQSMSRSVSLLRTSLIDAGIARPIFDLLKHPMLEVRIAATEVCCNLVLEFSPMREDLLSAGVIKTLAEHARQSEMALRLSSLWALKHLVLSAPREVKVQTLEELGVGWLVAAIQGDQQAEVVDASGGGVVLNASGGLSAPNAAGERVDLLNPSSMDVDDPPASSYRDFDDEEDGEVMYDEASLTHYRASNLRSTLSRPASSTAVQSGNRYFEALRDVEQNSELRARRDDVAVQEQGLDLIRNLLNGDDCAVMFEHLLNQVGTKQVFAMLTEKLTPLNSQQHAATSSRGAAMGTRPVYQPTPLILATVHVLTHMANGSPQQKQLLIAQKPLLSAWLPHFNHPDRRVRCVSVWAVNSLAWVEDEGDRGSARERLRVLKEVGVVQAVEGLRGDGDLDVRERVRVAVRGFEGLG